MYYIQSTTESIQPTKESKSRYEVPAGIISTKVPHYPRIHESPLCIVQHRLAVLGVAVFIVTKNYSLSNNL